jgi:hypothetical protein
MVTGMHPDRTTTEDPMSHGRPRSRATIRRVVALPCVALDGASASASAEDGDVSRARRYDAPVAGGAALPARARVGEPVLVDPAHARTAPDAHGPPERSDQRAVHRSPRGLGRSHAHGGEPRRGRSLRHCGAVTLELLRNKSVRGNCPSGATKATVAPSPDATTLPAAVGQPGVYLPGMTPSDASGPGVYYGIRCRSAADRRPGRPGRRRNGGPRLDPASSGCR